MFKTVFPALASFGPLFLAIGCCLFPNRGGFPFGFLMAAPGALMTSAALLMVFQALVKLESAPATIEK